MSESTSTYTSGLSQLTTDSSSESAVLFKDAPSSAPSTSNSTLSGVVPFPTGVFSQRYLMTREELGRGQFGVVRTCVSRLTGKLFACKSMLKCYMQQSTNSSLKTEICLMGLLSRHPNIVSHVEVFEDATSVHLILERCPLGDLFSLVELSGYLPEAIALPIFRKIVEGIHYCHSNGIVHRDLKPENIFLGLADSGEVQPKIGDFGLARQVEEITGKEGFVGSMTYVAPEIILNQRYTSAADIWSLGVVLYVMLAGAIPFPGNSSGQVLRSICQRRLDMNTGKLSHVSPNVKDLILRMLDIDATKRPSALEILCHPWLSSALTHTSGRSTSEKRCPQVAAVSPLPQKRLRSEKCSSGFSGGLTPSFWEKMDALVASSALPNKGSSHRSTFAKKRKLPSGTFSPCLSGLSEESFLSTALL